jgi:hypothetical protein
LSFLHGFDGFWVKTSSKSVPLQVDVKVQIRLRKRVFCRVIASRRILQVGTQRTRKKLIKQLEEIFEIATNYARGNVTWVIDENDKKRMLTIIERRWWAKIAAQTASTINNIAKGFDEREIDDQLDLLEAMLNQTPPAKQVAATLGSEKAERKSAGPGDSAKSAASAAQ